MIRLIIFQQGGRGLLLPLIILMGICVGIMILIKRFSKSPQVTSIEFGIAELKGENKMKLTLNRTEEQKSGIFKKTIVYHLDVNVEVTPEEMALIKKHEWGNLPFCEGMFLASRVIEFYVGDVVGKPHRFSFKSVNELAHVEKQIIENAKKLKQQLEAAVGFTSGGPREIEL